LSRGLAAWLADRGIGHETQVGLLPRLGGLFLAPRLYPANQAMFADLARTAGQDVATRVTPAA
jgi:hypothetical protein